jgi:Carboxypeptidase regulatory-like domain/TonB-dependent Receptor Plug Domain
MISTRLFSRFLPAIVAVILAFLLSPARSSAQTIVTGGLSGTVTDPTGAIIEGATITLKSAATGEVFTATSAASGIFQFSLLKPGDYTLTVAKEGFRNSTRTVTVQLGQVVPANVALEVGSSTQTVEVSSAPALLQTETANITTTIETKQIQEIPNPGGDITYVAQTAPGVTMNSSTLGGYGNFSTFGLPGTSNLFTMNGNDYNDPFLNLNNSGSSNLLLGGNEVQEVAVVNNAYTGQYGRQAGSQIDYSTKSGTNAFHGDAIYDWTGRYLTANDPINKATSPAGGPINPRPFENNNQWAASFGGPIIKNKVFFFVNNEGIRYIFGSIHPATIPTPAFQSYVMSNLPSVVPASELGATQSFYSNLFKLWNGAPNVANATPNAGSCSSNGLPATIGGDACTESWSDSVSSGNKEWLISGRVDYNISDNDKLFGRVKFDRGVQPTYTDTINPTFDTFSTQPQNEGQLNYTHVFSPAVLNQFIGSVLYYSAIFGSISSNSPALSLLPGNLIFTDGSVTNLGFGSGNINGFAAGFLFPQGRNVTQWGLVDDLSITRGNHAFKMGVNFRRDDISDHTASETAFYPAVQTTLLGFANDAAVSGTNYNFAISPVQPVAFYSFGLYFQDEFRVTPKLKLTLTLRADRNSGGVCQHACASLPETEFTSLPHGADIPYNQSFLTGNTTIIPNVELVAFQPRFGLAWTPWGDKTVIRTGIGLFSDLYPGTVLSNIDTNFPQVNLWNVPDPASGSLAWDLQPPSTTAFPTSGVSLVQTCNTAFTNNYNSGGSLTSYLATPGLPAACATTPALNDVSRNLSNPKYVEWNLEVQRMLTPRTVLSVNYVGNRGFDELYTNGTVNAFGFGSLPAAPVDPRVGRVNILNSGAISNYNGVTVSLEQSFWRGLTGRLNYTWSHSLDEVSNGGVLPFTINYSVVNQIDPYNLRDNYASSDYDVRNQLSASYIYELPIKSSNRALNSVIGGWQLSGTLFARGGFPFSVIDSATIQGLAGNNLGNITQASILLQPTFSQRDFSNVGSCVRSACFGIVGGVNPTAPYLFEPATNFTGDAVGRNAFRGPGFLGGDMSIRKNFKINERIGLQIGLNAYNWFNHANYGAPAPGTIFGSSFGQVIFTQTSPTSPYGAFAAAATDMRIAQLQAKVTF